jgi:hypothetical protein
MVRGLRFRWLARCASCNLICNLISWLGCCYHWVWIISFLSPT